MTDPIDRRAFLHSSLVAGGWAGALVSGGNTDQTPGGGSVGSSAFPVYNVRGFGARGDGRAADTAAVQLAIRAAAAAGGGVAYVPPGTYSIGTVRLESHVTLFIEAGATLIASTSRQDYPDGCLIYGEDAIDAAVCGRGTIDGNGPSFWQRKADGTWTSQPWRPRDRKSVV